MCVLVVEREGHASLALVELGFLLSDHVPIDASQKHPGTWSTVLEPVLQACTARKKGGRTERHLEPLVFEPRLTTVKLAGGDGGSSPLKGKQKSVADGAFVERNKVFSRKHQSIAEGTHRLPLCPAPHVLTLQSACF